MCAPRSLGLRPRGMVAPKAGEKEGRGLEKERRVTSAESARKGDLPKGRKRDGAEAGRRMRDAAESSRCWACDCADGVVVLWAG